MSKLSVRKRAFIEISSSGSSSSSPCDWCCSQGIDCVKMSDDNKKLKCAECTRRGKACVSFSWESLDRTRDNLREELDRDEAEAERLFDLYIETRSRIRRKRKVLQQAQGRAAKKFKCLIEEMEAEGEDMTATVIDGSVLEATLFGPEAGQSFIDVVGGTVAAEGGSSQDS